MFAPRGWFSRRFHRQVYRTISAAGAFDASYYRRYCLQGLARLQDPLWHFVTSGWKNGHSPSVEFDTPYYLLKNDDVKVANLNPLFHYLEYGQAERRLPVRSSLEAQHAAIPEASPLRYFITPSLGQRRVSVLLDSATDLSQPGALAEIVNIASQAAASQDASLRILMRPGIVANGHLEQVLESVSNRQSVSLDITEVPTTLTYSDIPFFDDEIAIATSWSSSLALQFTTAPENSRVTLTSGSDISLSSNSEETRQALIVHSIRVPRELEKLVTARLVETGPSRRPGILVWVDVDSFPLAYMVLIQALTDFFLSRGPDQALPPVTLFGNPGSRFAIGEELQPTLFEGIPAVSSDLPGHCVIVMSSHSDENPMTLAGRGFSVIHAIPGEHPINDSPVTDTSRVVRTTLTAESLVVALEEVLG